MIDFANVDLPGGPFILHETYVYYDGPRAFGMCGRLRTWDWPT